MGNNLIFSCETWLTQMKQHQGAIFPFTNVKENKHWFEYLFNAENPRLSTYRCRLCHKYFDKLKLDSRYKSALAQPEGVLKKSYDSNREMIMNHARQSQHQLIIEKLQSEAINTLPQQFREIQENSDKENLWHFAATIRMI